MPPHYQRDAGIKAVEWASPKQLEAFAYGPSPLCVSGGFGAAKTYALCLKALWLSDRYPRNRGVIARKVAKELSLTTMATFYKICPPTAYDPAAGGRRADSENYLRLARSGSEILFLHLDAPDIDSVVRGLEINWFILDQAEEIAEEMYDMLSSRLGRWDLAEVPPEVLAEHGGIDKWEWKNRAGNPIPPVYPMIACNPDAETHWIWRRFHEESSEWKERYEPLGYRMISMSSRENKFLPKQNLDEMLRKDDSFVRRFVDAKWGIPEGQIHNVRESSLIPGTPAIVEYIKQRSVMHMTMDHGDAAPTCVIAWAVDRGGNLIGMWEYYKPNLLVSDHRRNIAVLAGGDKFQFKLADPSIFYKTMQKYGGRWSFSDDYADRNVNHGFDPDNAIFWNPADNDEMGTRNLINEYLRPQGNGQIHHGPEQSYGNLVVKAGEELPRVHPITGEYGYWPRLFFITKTADWPDGCDKAVLHTRSQRRERVGTELGKPIFSDERDTGIPDHAYDPVRYMVSSRAAGPGIKTATYAENSFYGVRDKLERFKKRGGWRKLAERVSLGA